jgi:GNAT superfamily N-acetyltransferase
MITTRKVTVSDADALMDLYVNHLSRKPQTQPQNIEKWRGKIAKFEADPLYHILVGTADGRVVSSVTLVVIENLTNDLRPYAVIENVVTHADFRGRGYASALMQKASDTAEKLNCYKIMLLTGSKKESTLAFYENCGFNLDEKTGFIKRF